MVIYNHFEILSDEHKVDAAESKLGDTQEHIDHFTGNGGKSSQCWTRSGKCQLGDSGVVQRLQSGSLTNSVGGVDQHMHAGNTKYTEYHEANGTDQKSGVFDGVRHCQDSSSYVAFQQVDDSITAPKMNLILN